MCRYTHTFFLFGALSYECFWPYKYVVNYSNTLLTSYISFHLDRIALFFIVFFHISNGLSFHWILWNICFNIKGGPYFQYLSAQCWVLHVTSKSVTTKIHNSHIVDIGFALWLLYLSFSLNLKWIRRFFFFIFFFFVEEFDTALELPCPVKLPNWRPHWCIGHESIRLSP